MVNVIRTEFDDTRTNVLIVKEREIDPYPSQLNSPQLIFEFLQEYFGFSRSTQERMMALYMDSKNHIHNVQLIGIGTQDAAACSPRDILMTALITGSTHIILAHCHPSGIPTPSQIDDYLTERVSKAAKICDIQLLDHLICGDKYYYSYCEEGKI